MAIQRAAISAIAFTACLIGGLISTPCAAETLLQGNSAADLAAMCSARGDKSEVCDAYIAGYSQGFYYASASAQAGYIACVPHGLGQDQVRFIFSKFVSNHAEMLQQSAASVVAESLLASFPCAARH